MAHEPLPLAACHAALNCDRYWADIAEPSLATYTRGGRGRWRWCNMKLRNATSRSIAPVRGNRVFTRITFAT